MSKEHTNEVNSQHLKTNFIEFRISQDGSFEDKTSRIRWTWKILDIDILHTKYLW